MIRLCKRTIRVYKRVSIIIPITICRVLLKHTSMSHSGIKLLKKYKTTLFLNELISNTYINIYLHTCMYVY